MAEITRKPRKKLATPRPPVGDATKRPTLSFRVSQDLSEKLRNSAEKSQTSISEEIERRLIASFAKIEDAETEAVMSLIAENFKVIQAVMDEKWFNESKTKIMCAKAAEATIITFGSIIKERDFRSNILRETIRYEEEKGGVGAAIYILERHGKLNAPDIAQVARQRIHDVAVDHQKKRAEALAKALADFAPPNKAQTNDRKAQDAE